MFNVKEFFCGQNYIQFLFALGVFFCMLTVIIIIKFRSLYWGKF